MKLPEPGKRWGTRRPAVAKYYRTVGGRRWHVVRAEHALGRKLPVGAVVHHADGTKRDDAPLVICENEQYHRFLHKLLRIKQAGGHPHRDRICGMCRRVLPMAEFFGDVLREGRRCNACNRRYVRDHREREKRAKLA